MCEVIKVKRFDIAECRKNPKNLYVYGDNLLEWGKAGQAIIRGEPNAIGIPTKRLPSLNEDAFFDDSGNWDQYVTGAIDRLQEIIDSGKYEKIVLPVDGLGTGLAQLPTRAPKLLKIINDGLENLQVSNSQGE